MYGRLTSDILRNGTATLSSITYGYEGNDLLKSKSMSGLAGSGEHGYTHDHAGRLTSWTYGGKTTSYEWDDAGNRVKVDGKVSAFDERNRLLSDGDKSYAWSARGTLRSAGADRYEFDAFGRMVTRSGHKFAYMGAGLDVVSDGKATFSRGLSGDVLATQRGLALTDSHGDALAELAPSGESASAATSYDLFGKVLSGVRSGVGFQSDWTDPDSGDVDMGARWYSPSMGAFTARDSISLPTTPSGDANRFSYGRGSPATYVDPDGHSPVIAPPGTDWGSKLFGAIDEAMKVGGSAAPAFRFGSRAIPFVGQAMTVMDVYYGITEKPQVEVRQSSMFQKIVRSNKPDNGNSPSFTNLLSGLFSQLISLARQLRDLIASIRWPGGYNVGNSIGSGQVVWDPSVVARAEAAEAARTVALSPPQAATQPIIEEGVVSTSPLAPASKVAVESGDVRDANEVVQQIRDAVLGTGNPVIQNAAEQDPSELSGSGSANIYTEGGIFNVIHNGDGTKSIKGTPCYLGRWQKVCFGWGYNGHPVTYGDYFFFPKDIDTFNQFTQCEAIERLRMRREHGVQNSEEKSSNLPRHESVHAWQAGTYSGPGGFALFGLDYDKASGYSRKQSPSKTYWEWNNFEIQANLIWGGYRSPPFLGYGGCRW